MNIKAGDLLVVNGVSEYPIRSVAFYTAFGSTRTFARMAIAPASTKRNPQIVGGKRGEPETLLTDLYITPLEPVDAETRQRLALDTPHNLYQTHLADETGFAQLIVEDLLV